MNKKTIWITGGSTGIGRALAIKFASKGWNVAVSARRVELLNELSNTYENISAFPLDVTNKLKCKEVFNEIKNKFENIDICFFSTGTWNPKKEKDIDVEQIEDVFKINFFGTVNSIKAVEEYFRNKKKRYYYDSFVYSWIQRITKLYRLWTIQICSK
jgi:NADP-dependent 3-hydroxy acid dehydrogenase YdfG